MGHRAGGDFGSLGRRLTRETFTKLFRLSGIAEAPVKVVTISSLMPLVLEDLPRPIVERLVGQWVTAPEHFWTPYPLPSVPASSPKFLPGNPRGFIWCGPT